MAQRRSWVRCSRASAGDGVWGVVYCIRAWAKERNGSVEMLVQGWREKAVVVVVGSSHTK